RNAERVGVETPGDVLAGRESGKHNFARLRPRIGAAKSFRLVDGQGEVSDLHAAAEAAAIFAAHLDVNRVYCGAVAQTGLGGVEQRLERHRFRTGVVPGRRGREGGSRWRR